jgi:uncharacterized delta-60 repeat protein
MNMNTTISLSTDIRTLVIIDSAVEDYQLLLNGILPTAEVNILNSQRDGIDQISEILGKQSFHDLQIIAHGHPGSVQLGNSQLNLENIYDYQEQLQQWQVTNILIYGCRVAAGDAGAEFITKLHQITGANIAASTKLVGNGQLGGDWQLDKTTAEMAISLAVTSAVTSSYAGVLNNAPIVTTTGAVLSYTENAADIFVDSGITVSDSDTAHLISATISGFQCDDIVNFTEGNGITGSYNSNTGTLTLYGSSSVANYQTALRSVTYSNNSDTPNTAPRTISFVVNDGTENSAAATKTINVTAVNDAPSFNAFNRDDIGLDVKVQSDGKILVVGFTTINGTYDIALVRYNTDGSLDTSFDTDGIVTTRIGHSNDTGDSVTVQADGKILVAGYTWNGSNYDFALVRYNTDGSLDTSFDTDGIVTTDLIGSNDQGYKVTVQSDGKILLRGYTDKSGNTEVLEVQYNTDGSLDTSFGNNGILITAPTGNDFGNTVTYQTDGKILVVGNTWNGSNTDIVLVRYNSDGTTFDTSFGNNGEVVTDLNGGNDGAYSVTVDSDGKILVTGYTWNGSNYDFALVRYNSNGTLDNSFNSNVALLSTLNNNPTFIENGTAVILDSDVQIIDPELTAINNGYGNYAGATLTLSRNGGANTQDVFAFNTTGALFTVSGSDIQSGGQTFATFSQGSGTLTISFTSGVTIATQALVNDVLRHINYSNTSDTPPASVQINWDFADGNTGSQGTGGVQSVQGSTTVNITAVNDAPVVSNQIPIQSVENNKTFNYTLSDSIFTDPEGDTLTYSASNLPTWLTFDSSTRTFTGTANAVGTSAITVSVNDGNGNTTNTNFSVIVTTPVNTTTSIDQSASTTAVTITGTASSESIFGGSGNDTIRAGDGNDNIFGNGGNDKLYGNNGSDTLIGGLGTDNLWGGADNDFFVLQAVGNGLDVVNDFVDGVDKIGLSALYSGDLTFGSLTISPYGATSASTSILSGTTELMRLINVNSSLINESDFTNIA